MFPANRHQMSLPFPVTQFSLNNRSMSSDDSNEIYTRTSFAKTRRGTDSRAKSTPDAPVESTRTSDTRKRGTFDRTASKSSNLTDPANTVSPQQLASDNAKKLRNKALRLLTTREHSREELMKKLAQAKARAAYRNAEEKSRESAQQQKDDIEKLADDLAAQGWQSDDRYAEAIVRRLSGQASKRFIAEKLAQAGIKKEAAQVAVESIEVEDFDAASALWNRRFGDAPRDDRERQRHVRFLLSRGFHLNDAFKIVPRVARNVNNDE